MRMIVSGVALGALAVGALGGCIHVSVTDDKAGVKTAAVSCAGGAEGGAAISSSPVGSQAIGDAPGKTFTAVRLDVPPHSKANPHRHAGLVFVYVLDGLVCSQVTGDVALKPYGAGETFFEPPGSQHLGFTNPTGKPARVLVTFVADTGAALTAPVR
jgi:quercetin dioxygenase-like cupin family protein